MSEKPKPFLETIGWTAGFDLSDKPGLARALGVALFALAVVAVAIAVLVIGHFFVILITGSEGEPNPRDVEIRNIGLVAAAVLSVPFVIWRSVVAQQQADTAQQSLITTQITNAVEGLGTEKVVKVPETGSEITGRMVERTEPNIEGRVRAILSLERISERSFEDHIRIMEILCAYVRENACIVSTREHPENPEDWKQRIDTQLAVTVIGRRSSDQIDLEQERGYRLDLRGARLRQSDLVGGCWKNAYLQKSNLARSDLSKANLQGASLWEANLEGASLWHASLKSAYLPNAHLQDAQLVYANLERAELREANLRDANLHCADMRATKLEEADLQRARLERANLQEARLSGSKVQEANLDGANLSKALIKRADLSGANLFNANMEEADLARADLSRANLAQANMRFAQLVATDLKGAKLQDANLEGAQLRHANLRSADLANANLRGADLRSALFSRCFLRAADLSDCTNLQQKALNSAFGVRSGVGQTILPEGLVCPQHWYVALDLPKDSQQHRRAAFDAYNDWLATLPDDEIP